MKIVQIGCNNGDDEVYKIITSQHIDFALLVDANPFVLEDLTKVRYKNFNNVKIECHLISNDDTEKHFYIPHFDVHKYSQHSSMSKEHLLKHGHKLEDVKSFLVKSISIEKLFDLHNLVDIDYLFLDCECEDFNIINNIDFNRFNIKKITFEHAHIPNRNINYPYILNKLNSYGYEIECINLGNITLIKKENDFKK